MAQKVVCDISTMIGVYQTESVETAAFSVARTVGRVLGQVVLHQGQRVLDVTAVNHAQAGGGRELRPETKLYCDLTMESCKPTLTS